MWHAREEFFNTSIYMGMPTFSWVESEKYRSVKQAGCLATAALLCLWLQPLRLAEGKHGKSARYSTQFLAAGGG